MTYKRAMQRCSTLLLCPDNKPTLDKQTAIQVNFTYNNQLLVGYIDEEGAVIAIACEVKNETLPFIIRESIAKNYPAYQVKNVMELVRNGELCYMFTLSNEKKMIYARVDSFGDTQVLKTVKRAK